MKIAISDEQSHIRAALRLLISEKTDHSVLLEILCADSLLPKLIETPVEVLIVDWSFLKVDGTERLKAIHDSTDVKVVIVISGNSADQQLAIEAGADGFLSKSDSPESVLSLLTQLTAASDET